MVVRQGSVGSVGSVGSKNFVYSFQKSILKTTLFLIKKPTQDINTTCILCQVLC
ncbi:MAG: hypothetical protein AB4080_05610 [Trichodesmium sp.]